MHGAAAREACLGALAGSRSPAGPAASSPWRLASGVWRGAAVTCGPRHVLPRRFCCGFTIVWEYIRIPCFNQDQGMVFSWAFNYAYVGTVLLLFMRRSRLRRAVLAVAGQLTLAAPRLEALSRMRAAAV